MLFELVFEVAEHKPVFVCAHADGGRFVGLDYLQKREVRRVFDEHDVALVEKRFAHEIEPLLSSAEHLQLLGGGFKPYRAEVFNKLGAQVIQPLGLTVLQQLARTRSAEQLIRYPADKLARQPFRRRHASRKRYDLGSRGQLEYLARRRARHIFYPCAESVHKVISVSERHTPCTAVFL